MKARFSVVESRALPYTEFGQFCSLPFPPACATPPFTYRSREIQKEERFPPNRRCGSVETCRKAARSGGCEVLHRGGGRTAVHDYGRGHSEKCPKGLPQHRKQEEKEERNLSILDATSKKIPTLIEIQTFAEQEGLCVDVQKFYDYYTETGWMTKNQQPITNWKSTLLYWNQSEGTPHKKTKQEEPRSENADIIRTGTSTAPIRMSLLIISHERGGFIWRASPASVEHTNKSP